MTHESALDAILLHARDARIDRAGYLRAPGGASQRRYDAGELPVDVMDILLGGAVHDVQWISDLVSEIDMMRAEVGVVGGRAAHAWALWS